jgi:hypothetical protein
MDWTGCPGYFLFFVVINSFCLFPRLHHTQTPLTTVTPPLRKQLQLQLRTRSCGGCPRLVASRAKSLGYSRARLTKTKQATSAPRSIQDWAYGGS